MTIPVQKRKQFRSRLLIFLLVSYYLRVIIIFPKSTFFTIKLLKIRLKCSKSFWWKILKRITQN